MGKSEDLCFFESRQSWGFFTFEEDFLILVDFLRYGGFFHRSWWYFLSIIRQPLFSIKLAISKSRSRRIFSSTF